jgi:hypothetical protein
MPRVKSPYGGFEWYVHALLDVNEACGGHGPSDITRICRGCTILPMPVPEASLSLEPHANDDGRRNGGTLMPSSSFVSSSTRFSSCCSSSICLAGAWRLQILACGWRFYMSRGSQVGSQNCQRERGRGCREGWTHEHAHRQHGAMRSRTQYATLLCTLRCM